MFIPLTHTKAGSSDANSVTTPAIDTTGADVIVLDLAYNTNLPIVSDSKGNVWAPLADGVTGANRHRRHICLPTHVGPGHTFTADGASSFPALCVQAFSGCAQTDPVEQHASALGPMTPTHDGALIVAGIAVVSPTPGAVATSVSGGFTLADAVPFPSGVTLGAALAYKIQIAAAVENPSFTMSASSTLAGSMTILKSAAAGPPVDPPPVVPPAGGSLVQLFVDGTLVFPTPIDKAPVGLPIVVSGQSNAVNLQFALALPALYSSTVFAGCLSNTPIAAWAPDTTLWSQLEAGLHQPLTAVVWWQGETDFNLNTQSYVSDLRALLARIRAANGNPHLLIAIVQIVPYANNGWLRDMQAAVVASDPYTVLVRMDGIPTDGGVHLVWLPGLENGYVAGAQRILGAIGTRQ